ncbi:MAG TPA: monovalent cation:proton antiporter-2 (CPA2) family protein, partial [Hyphomicrobiaceae bacterium]|nr:monovalent cation:proton antiporter-2 (CPA2) family protein [Hyphomicrobiaceae bacterium]
MHDFLVQAAIFLLAAAVAAPLARRVGIGSVLGYLFAGVLIGPYGLGRIYPVYSAESVLRYAELGVVLLLFVIGLELQPSRLKAMRAAVFGAGALQVVGTGLVLTLGALIAGMSWGAAFYVGLALSLSSTAFTLQALGERKELATRHGRLAFAILLFQDLAALPILALVPLLAGAVSTAFSPMSVAKALAVVAAVLLLGRPILRHVYRLIARAGLHEAMIATALLTVIVTALAMEAAGLSAALGAFVAGVLLADSEYRHEVEADIEPFKGLLLGLFFTAIGMALNLGLLASRPVTILGLVVAVVAAKAAVLVAI